MDVALTPASRVVASQEQLSAALSGEAVILGTRDDVYYGLDRVGARIWALVQEPRTLADVADTLVAEYDVAREVALADLLVLVRGMVERGLIEVLPAPPA